MLIQDAYSRIVFAFSAKRSPSSPRGDGSAAAEISWNIEKIKLVGDLDSA
jgi:hypothetical protein